MHILPCQLNTRHGKNKPCNFVYGEENALGSGRIKKDK